MVLIMMNRAELFVDTLLFGKKKLAEIVWVFTILSSSGAIGAIGMTKYRKAYQMNFLAAMLTAMIVHHM